MSSNRKVFLNPYKKTKHTGMDSNSFLVYRQAQDTGMHSTSFLVYKQTEADEAQNGNNANNDANNNTNTAKRQNKSNTLATNIITQLLSFIMIILLAAYFISQWWTPRPIFTKKAYVTVKGREICNPKSWICPKTGLDWMMYDPGNLIKLCKGKDQKGDCQVMVANFFNGFYFRYDIGKEDQIDEKQDITLCYLAYNEKAYFLGAKPDTQTFKNCDTVTFTKKELFSKDSKRGLNNLAYFIGQPDESYYKFIRPDKYDEVSKAVVKNYEGGGDGYLRGRDEKRDDEKKDSKKPAEKPKEKAAEKPKEKPEDKAEEKKSL